MLQNTALKAARARWDAARARVPQARAWNDPQIGVDLERAGTTRLPEVTDSEWTVVQTLPLSGQNRRRAQSAAAEAAAAQTELRSLELNLAARAQAAYFRYANAFAQLELNRRNDSILQGFSAITRAKYETGAGLQADVLTAETERAKLGEARFDLERQASEAQTEMNALMNRAAHDQLDRPAPLVFKPIEWSRFGSLIPGHGSEADLVWDWPLFQFRMQTLAKEHRPDLIRARKKLESAQALHELAKRAWIPDPEIRIETRQFNDRAGSPVEYDTGIFFNLPWLNRPKYKAAILEARKNTEAAAFDLAALEAETLGLVKDQLKRIEVVQHHYETYRDAIVPLARQMVQAQQSAYTTDKASFLELLTALRAANETESELHQHLADYLSAVAELEAMVGASKVASPGGP